MMLPYIDPGDYDAIIDELKIITAYLQIQNLILHVRYLNILHYDSLIAEYLGGKMDKDRFSQTITFTYEKVQDMRYGENPHQKAAFYKEINNDKGYLTSAIQLHGKELSFNNINDANGTLMLLKEFDEPTVVALKHANLVVLGVQIIFMTLIKRLMMRIPYPYSEV